MMKSLPDLRSDQLLLTRRSRIILFICVAVLGYIITGLFTSLLLFKFGATSVKALRIAAVAQDVFALIAPAVITAVMVTRLPAQLLELRGGVRLPVALLALSVVAVSVPAMNCVIRLNESISFTGSLAPLTEALRSMEENATAVIGLMQGNGTWGDLFVNILILGVAAGFSEELFFRGALQRLLSLGGMKAHTAIWVSAIVFSAVHLQFFGFVPRMLLGAYFGYLLLWSRSIWLPAAAHAFNNTLYVIAQWCYTRNGEPDVNVNNVGLDGTWPIAIVSAAATAAVIYLVYRIGRKS
ncbi:MAG: CPBP family intramembrane metalloprotease [Muribaculaceae bacterium]|nr:CPBP family intramembrane metalloprotease [Muribaculaceae bacterium]